MKAFRVITLLLPILLVSCSRVEPLASGPCPLKDQRECKERDLLIIRANIYFESLRKYADCLYSENPKEYLQACGAKPQWKDFK